MIELDPPLGSRLPGILPESAEHLGHGCCSIGADLDGEDEARRVSALAATLEPSRFEHHAESRTGGVFSDGSHTSTRVVDGVCIFLNRPAFPARRGCALHLEAARAGESPVVWKPLVCWQLPIKVDWEPADDGTEVATGAPMGAARLREGETMGWWCTEGAEAYVGSRRPSRTCSASTWSSWRRSERAFSAS